MLLLWPTQAFTSSGNGAKPSLEEINRLIGINIKEAAANVGVIRVYQANAAIGKFVKKAADDAAAGRLKKAGSKPKAASR